MVEGFRNRLIVWSGVDTWRAEACELRLSTHGMTAEGTQIGGTPVPYRLHYQLDAMDGFLTRRLSVDAAGEGWSRRLLLLHDGEGSWTIESDHRGSAPLPDAGGDPRRVQGALDCDLGLCPATNTMPVVRHSLHRGPGEGDFLMAWVSVPDLAVHPSRQRYQHVRMTDAGSVVRYIGEHRNFVGDLELDPDGVVVFYPELARMLGGPR